MFNAWKKPLTGLLVGTFATAVSEAADLLIKPWLFNIDAARLQQQGYDYVPITQCATCYPQPGRGPDIIASLISLLIAAIVVFLLLLVLRYQRKQALKISIIGLVSSYVIIGLPLLQPLRSTTVLEGVVYLIAFVLGYWIPVMSIGNTATSKK